MMSSFQPKSLSDEDIARLLDICPEQLVLDRRAQIWRCPACGQEIRAALVDQVPETHLRPEREQVSA